MKKEGTTPGKLNIKEKMAKHIESYMLNFYLDNERLPSVSEVKAHIQTVFKFVIYPPAHRKYTDYILDLNRKLSKSIKYKRQRAQEIAREIWPIGSEVNEKYQDMAQWLVFRWLVNGCLNLASKKAIKDFIKMMQETQWIDQRKPYEIPLTMKYDSVLEMDRDF